MDEYKFDGYRFDGVTSMMYHHHGLQMSFSGHYDEYFGFATDTDAVVYLMLCNCMLHDLFPTCTTIGEKIIASRIWLFKTVDQLHDVQRCEGIRNANLQVGFSYIPIKRLPSINQNNRAYTVCSEGFYLL